MPIDRERRPNASSHSLAQLSLRHIPDLSDSVEEDASMLLGGSPSRLETSFSIHMTGVGSNTLLADEDAENFFRGVDADMTLEDPKFSVKKRLHSTAVEKEVPVPNPSTRRTSPRKGKAKAKLQVDVVRAETEGQSTSSVPFPSPPMNLELPATQATTHQPTPASPPPSQTRATSVEDDPTIEERDILTTSKLRTPRVRKPRGIRRSSILKEELDTSVITERVLRSHKKTRSDSNTFTNSILPVSSSTEPPIVELSKEPRLLKPPSIRRNTMRTVSSYTVPLKEESETILDAPSFADASSSSIAPSGSAAARLMQYETEYTTTQPLVFVPEASAKAEEDVPMQDAQPNRVEAPEIVVEPSNDFTESRPMDVSQQVAERGGESLHSIQESADGDIQMEEPSTEDDREGPLKLSHLSPKKLVSGAASETTNSKKRALPDDDTREDQRTEQSAPSVEEGPKTKKSRMNGMASKAAVPSKPRAPSRAGTRARSGTVSARPRRAVTNPVGSGSSVPSNSGSRTVVEPRVGKVSAKPASMQLPGTTELVVRPPGREIKTNRRIVSASNADGERKVRARIAVPAFNPAVGWNDDVHLQGLKEKENKRVEGSRVMGSSGHSVEDKDRSITRSRGHLRTRSHNDSQTLRTSNYHPAPNFKAIHEAFDASLAARKEAVHPTVPVEMQWETDVRMEQRKKFDEMVREKEREKERAEEEERRRREVEEEREMKEMRKRLVVKANEVPEWYKDVPRKAKEV